jgi:hypothetical protein
MRGFGRRRGCRSGDGLGDGIHVKYVFASGAYSIGAMVVHMVEHYTPACRIASRIPE